jgi:hypothetical protein
MLAVNDCGPVFSLSIRVATLLVLHGLRAKKLHLNILDEQDFLPSTSHRHCSCMLQVHLSSTIVLFINATLC